MRIAFTFFALIIAMSAVAQKKVKYNGLNKNLPHENSFGFKGQANYYFASFVPNAGDADSAAVSGSELMGGGLGAFYRFDFNDHAGLQTELFVHHRQGRAVSISRYDIDTAVTVYKEELSGYNETWLEIPVYFKYRWEFTNIGGGHWKSNSALGVYIGPRAVIAPFSHRDLSRSTYSVLYNQSSFDVQNHISRDDDQTPRFSSFAGLGVAAGLDFEVRSGFMIHAAFYRGLLSYSVKSHGYKMFDNRIELGIGIRVY